jgi:flagellum-specific peptidoglycan hydrolase FlgJ
MDAQAIDTAVYNQATSMGVSPTVASIIVAQARLESGDYTNNASTKYNNLFGYKWIGQKKWATGPANTSSEGNPYAAYPSVQASTGELVDWLFRRQAEGKFVVNNLTTPEAYATALKGSGYYGITADAYSDGLDAKLKKLLVVIGSNAGAIAVIALVAYFFSLKDKKK